MRRYVGQACFVVSSKRHIATSPTPPRDRRDYDRIRTRICFCRAYVFGNLTSPILYEIGLTSLEFDYGLGLAAPAHTTVWTGGWLLDGRGCNCGVRWLACFVLIPMY
jgi:hypothetical protein